MSVVSTPGSTASQRLLRLSELGPSLPCRHHCSPTTPAVRARTSAACPSWSERSPGLLGWCDGQQMAAADCPKKRARYVQQMYLKEGPPETEQERRERKHRDQRYDFKHYADISSYTKEYSEKYSSTSQYLAQNKRHSKKSAVKKRRDKFAKMVGGSSSAGGGGERFLMSDQSPLKNPTSALPIYEQMMLACQSNLHTTRFDDPRFPLHVVPEHNNIYSKALCPKLPTKTNIFHSTFVPNKQPSTCEDWPSVTVYHYVDKNNKFRYKPIERKPLEISNDAGAPGKAPYRFPLLTRQTTIVYPDVRDAELMVCPKDNNQTGNISAAEEARLKLEMQLPPLLSRSLSSIRSTECSDIVNSDNLPPCNVIVLPEIIETNLSTPRSDNILKLRLQGISMPNQDEYVCDSSRIERSIKRALSERSDTRVDTRYLAHRSYKPRPLGKPQAKHIIRIPTTTSTTTTATTTNMCPPLRGSMVTRRQQKQRHSLQLARALEATPPGPPPVPPSSEQPSKRNALLMTRGCRFDQSSNLRCKLLDRLKSSELKGIITNLSSISYSRGILVNR